MKSCINALFKSVSICHSNLKTYESELRTQMNISAILVNIRLPDIIDILFISIFTYQLYHWFWGTKAFKAVIGLFLLSGIYIIAKSWGLFLTSWVFQIMWQVFVILLIILFQKEIRQMLEKFNPLQKFGFKSQPSSSDWNSSFVKWSFEAALKRIGAVIIFERTELVDDLMTKGISLESVPGPEVLNSIFFKESPLHDGAILIRKGKITKASCYLPLSSQEDLPTQWGTRYRAALGLAEQCDAWVMIISEETGEISMAKDDKVHTITDENHLSLQVEEAVLTGKENNIEFKDKIKGYFTRRFKIKGGVFIGVFIIWMLFAGQQNFEKNFKIPVSFKNIPHDLVVTEPVNRLVSITFRGLRKDVSLLNQDNVQTFVNLYSAKEGMPYYNINAGNLNLPNDRVHVINIKPARIQIKLEQKS
jgi:diadenylate cyclase